MYMSISLRLVEVGCCQDDDSTACRARNAPDVSRTVRTGNLKAATDEREDTMPPRGVTEGSKRGRQYEHVKESLRDRGASASEAEEIAARTVNKERARHGESRTSSSLSRRDISSGRRGGLRSHRKGPRGRTKAQLYEEAKRRGIHGRSTMTKAELERALGGRR
jgi:hypothetical protein